MTKKTLDPELDPGLSFDSPVLDGLLQAWRTAAAGKPMPSHGDIDPIRIGAALLPHVLLIDVEHEPRLRYRWRLIGTHITTALDRDRTGSYWDEVDDMAALASMHERTDWVLRNRMPLRSTGRSVTPERDFDINEALFMPLSDDGEIINMIMMGSVYSFRGGAGGLGAA